jgi:hypothetical protein
MSNPNVPPFSNPDEVMTNLIEQDKGLNQNENMETFVLIHLPDFSGFGTEFAKQMADAIDTEVNKAYNLFQEGYQRITLAMDKFEIKIDRRDEMVQLYISKSIKELKNQYGKNTNDNTRHAFDNVISNFAARAANYSTDAIFQSIYTLDMSDSSNHETYMTVLERAKAIYINIHNEVVYNRANTDPKYTGVADRLFTSSTLNLVQQFANNTEARFQLGILTERFLQRSRNIHGDAATKQWNSNFSKLIDSLLENKKEEA